MMGLRAAVLVSDACRKGNDVFTGVAFIISTRTHSHITHALSLNPLPLPSPICLFVYSPTVSLVHTGAASVFDALSAVPTLGFRSPPAGRAGAPPDYGDGNGIILSAQDATHADACVGLQRDSVTSSPHNDSAPNGQYGAGRTSVPSTTTTTVGNFTRGVGAGAAAAVLAAASTSHFAAAATASADTTSGSSGGAPTFTAKGVVEGRPSNDSRGSSVSSASTGEGSIRCVGKQHRTRQQQVQPSTQSYLQLQQPLTYQQPSPSHQQPGQLFNSEPTQPTSSQSPALTVQQQQQQQQQPSSHYARMGRNSSVGSAATQASTASSSVMTRSSRAASTASVSAPPPMQLPQLLHTQQRQLSSGSRGGDAAPLTSLAAVGVALGSSALTPPGGGGGTFGFDSGSPKLSGEALISSIDRGSQQALSPVAGLRTISSSQSDRPGLSSFLDNYFHFKRAQQQQGALSQSPSPSTSTSLLPHSVSSNELLAEEAAALLPSEGVQTSGGLDQSLSLAPPSPTAFSTSGGLASVPPSPSSYGTTTTAATAAASARYGARTAVTGSPSTGSGFPGTRSRVSSVSSVSGRGASGGAAAALASSLPPALTATVVPATAALVASSAATVRNADDYLHPLFTGDISAAAAHVRTRRVSHPNSDPSSPSATATVALAFGNGMAPYGVGCGPTIVTATGVGGNGSQLYSSSAGGEHGSTSEYGSTSGPGRGINMGMGGTKKSDPLVATSSVRVEGGGTISATTSSATSTSGSDDVPLHERLGTLFRGLFGSSSTSSSATSPSRTRVIATPPPPSLTPSVSPSSASSKRGFSSRVAAVNTAAGGSPTGIFTGSGSGSAGDRGRRRARVPLSKTPRDDLRTLHPTCPVTPLDPLTAANSSVVSTTSPVTPLTVVNSSSPFVTGPPSGSDIGGSSRVGDVPASQSIGVVPPPPNPAVDCDVPSATAHADAPSVLFTATSVDATPNDSSPGLSKDINSQLTSGATSSLPARAVGVGNTVTACFTGGSNVMGDNLTLVNNTSAPAHNLQPSHDAALITLDGTSARTGGNSSSVGVDNPAGTSSLPGVGRRSSASSSRSSTRTGSSGNRSVYTAAGRGGGPGGKVGRYGGKGRSVKGHPASPGQITYSVAASSRAVPTVSSRVFDGVVDISQSGSSSTVVNLGHGGFVAGTPLVSSSSAVSALTVPASAIAAGDNSSASVNAGGPSFGSGVGVNSFAASAAVSLATAASASLGNSERNQQREADSSGRPLLTYAAAAETVVTPPRSISTGYSHGWGAAAAFEDDFDGPAPAPAAAPLPLPYVTADVTADVGIDVAAAAPAGGPSAVSAASSISNIFSQQAAAAGFASSTVAPSYSETAGVGVAAVETTAFSPNTPPSHTSRHDGDPSASRDNVHFDASPAALAASLLPPGAMFPRVLHRMCRPFPGLVAPRDAVVLQVRVCVLALASC